MHHKASDIRPFLYFNRYVFLLLLLVCMGLQRSNKLNYSLFLQDKIHVLWRNLSGHRMVKRRGPLAMTEGTEEGEEETKLATVAALQTL